MTARFVIAGTDTDVGKTVFAAALAAALDGAYWKPVQAGLDGETDAQIVRRLSGLPPDRILPEVYALKTAASPHLAAERDDVTIDPQRLQVPPHDRPLIIEPAGGLMVPLTRSYLQIDLLAEWSAPVVLCARTAIGTINHSLLSIEALRIWNIPIHGIAFIGDANDDSERTIAALAHVRRLGRLPMVQPLDQHALAAAFAGGFRREDFAT